MMIDGKYYEKDEIAAIIATVQAPITGKPRFWRHLWSVIKYPFVIVHWKIKNRQHHRVLKRWQRLAGVDGKDLTIGSFGRPEKIGVIDYPGRPSVEQRFRPGGDMFPYPKNED